MSDLIPDTDDVLQEEAAPVPMTPIPVVAEGPVRVQELPARSAGWRTYDLLPTEAVKVLEADPRRRRAVIQATGDAIMLGGSQAGATAGARFGAGVLLEITTCDEVWARSVTTPPAACTLGVMNEQWAD
jgi:hypothetical protein